MEYPIAKRPNSVKILCLLLALYGVMGVISGLLLMADGSGKLLGFTADYQDKIPFHTFVPVGVFLFLVYGVGSLLFMYGAWSRKELVFEPVSKWFGFHWSYAGAMGMIFVLVGWLAAEGILIGLDFPATYFTISFGALIFIALLDPAVRRHLKVVSRSE
jgi:hypothetical protein